MITIFCENNGKSYQCEPGTKVSQLIDEAGIKLDWPILAAIVDNQLKELRFELFVTHNVRFVDYTHPDGYRTYLRSLFFVLQKAVADLSLNTLFCSITLCRTGCTANSGNL
jgi:uridine kinase